MGPGTAAQFEHRDTRFDVHGYVPKRQHRKGRGLLAKTGGGAGITTPCATANGRTSGVRQSTPGICRAFADYLVADRSTEIQASMQGTGKRQRPDGARGRKAFARRHVSHFAATLVHAALKDCHRPPGACNGGHRPGRWRISYGAVPRAEVRRALPGYYYNND